MKRLMLPMMLVLMIVGSVHARPAPVDAPPDREGILDAMGEELKRGMSGLRVEDFEPPYFLAYQLKMHDSYNIEVRYESVHRSGRHRDADVYVEARVGDYAFDNTPRGEDFFAPPFDIAEGLPVTDTAPIDGNLKALRASLWLMTDRAFKEALSQYQQKRGKVVYKKREKDLASFSREAPSVHVEKPLPFAFDRKRWERNLKELSALFRNHPEITQSVIRLQAGKETRYYVNSEGGRIADERVLFALSADAEIRAEDDMVMTNSRVLYGPGQDAMPSMKEAKKELEGMIAELLALRNAPLLDPYSGPAILSPQAAGVLFHEAVGHRLEGERQNNDEEGRTFKGRVGQKVLPEFLDLVDDPTLKVFGKTPLNGFYRFDDEGVPARRVTLVENGVLKNYLMSRTPVEGFPNSNGHGRSSGTRKPMARMGNTILKSRRAVSSVELEKRLIEMVKRQEKPYGLIIENMEGGTTNTSSYGYQAFKGVPRIVWRVFPDGRKELVRGVELVGTPLLSINKIVLTGDEYKVFNGFCGAESGSVPVSAVAPALLLEELELQRKKEQKGRPPILPNPYNGDNGKKADSR